MAKIPLDSDFEFMLQKWKIYSKWRESEVEMEWELSVN